jgi:hypothetical protein
MKIFEIDNSQHMLAMDPWTFDQTSQGWRSLPLDQQARILKLYIDQHVKNGKFKNQAHNEKIDPSVLIWHLGQVLAFLNKNAIAIKYMLMSRNSDSDWNNYVDATVAFIKKDKKAFDKIKIELNNNSEALIRLRDNWAKMYRDAY